MKIMAIDFGEKRTGLSICDRDEILASPIKTIVETNMDILIEKIAEIAENLKTEMIVVGCPMNMDGSFGQKAENSKKLAKKLEKRLDLEITLWDERQTTLLAQKFLNQSQTKKSKKKGLIDQVAATIILDSFLNFRKNEKRKS